jgi:hypothetical protein
LSSCELHQLFVTTQPPLLVDYHQCSSCRIDRALGRKQKVTVCEPMLILHSAGAVTSASLPGKSQSHAEIKTHHAGDTRVRTCSLSNLPPTPLHFDVKPCQLPANTTDLPARRRCSGRKRVGITYITDPTTRHMLYQAVPLAPAASTGRRLKISSGRPSERSWKTSTSNCFRRRVFPRNRNLVEQVNYSDTFVHVCVSQYTPESYL